MSTVLHVGEFAQSLQAHIDSPCRWQVRVLDEVDSTMDAAAAEPPPAVGEALCVVARSQTSGRGRNGRSWASTAGALLATIAVPWSKGIEDLSGGSLVVGVGIAQALERMLSCQPGELVKLKWPNDILDGAGHKLCGVLIQNRMVSGKSVILIGVGVNIFESPGEVPEATDLASVCQQESRELPDYLNLVTGLIIGIVSKWSQFEKSGFGNQQIAEWTERACGIGKPIEIDSGERVISGVMQGISRCGALLVKTVHGVQEVHAGHVLSPQVHSLSQEE